jgi:hypothetical protein
LTSLRKSMRVQFSGVARPKITAVLAPTGW